MVNPVLQLVRWQEVAEVLGIPRDQRVVSGDGLGCNQDIGVTLSGPGLPYEPRGYGEGLFVEVEDVKSAQEHLCLYA